MAVLFGGQVDDPAARWSQVPHGPELVCVVHERRVGARVLVAVGRDGAGAPGSQPGGAGGWEGLVGIAEGGCGGDPSGQRVRAGDGRFIGQQLGLVISGEADSPFVTGDIVCNLLTACGRVGDLARANEWTRVVEQQLGLESNRPRLPLCPLPLSDRTDVCDVGRWRKAEVTLRLAGRNAAHVDPASMGNPKRPRWR